MIACFTTPPFVLEHKVVGRQEPQVLVGVDGVDDIPLPEGAQANIESKT
jgi:hypothetical protein